MDEIQEKRIPKQDINLNRLIKSLTDARAAADERRRLKVESQKEAKRVRERRRYVEKKQKKLNEKEGKTESGDTKNQLVTQQEENRGMSPQENSIVVEVKNRSDLKKAKGVEKQQGNTEKTEVNRKHQSAPRPRKKHTLKADADRRAYERDRKRKQRQKIYADKRLHEEFLAKERINYQHRKKSGKIKMIAKKSKREQELARKRWRNNSRKFYQRRKTEKNMEIFIEQNSPPPSPIPRAQPGNDDILRKVRKAETRRIKQKRIAKNLAAENKKLKTKLEKYKKRNQRINRKLDLKMNTDSPSPGKKVKAILKKGAKAVKKKLLFGECVVKQVKSHFATSPKSEKVKFARIFKTPYFRKYGVSIEATKLLSHYSLFRNQKLRDMSYRKSLRLRLQMANIERDVRAFYCSDENSTPAPGKKDVITRKKIKRQKRFLNDTIRNLHKKFVEMHYKIGISTFFKLRPFFVLRFRMTERDTCGCIRHENFRFMLSKLNQLNIIASADSNELVKQLCCDRNNKKCMLRTCEGCQSREVTINHIEDEDEATFYHKWVKKDEERRNKKGNTVTFQVLCKEKINVTVKELTDLLQMEIPDFLKHLFIISNQYKYSQLLNEQLKVDASILKIDFSQNYDCKYFTEIQGMHFGPSRHSVTLHTGVFYLHKEGSSSNEDVENILEPHSFATVSDDPRHTAPAVWAHIDPILRELKDKGVKYLFVFSDGPSGQYKNKYNFFLMCQYGQKLGFEAIVWNFWASAHGKGPADGVGGTLKRAADDEICRKNIDIKSAKTFMAAVNDVNIKLLEIDSQAIDEISKSIPPDVQAVPRTKQLHQIIWTKDCPTQLKVRDFSCFHSVNSFNCDQCPVSTVSLASPVINTETVRSASPVNTFSVPNHQLIKENDWVVAMYESDWFPGKVSKVDKIDDDRNFLTIHFMDKIKFNNVLTFKWPQKIDIQKIPSDEILCQISAPTPIGKNARRFTLQEIDMIQSLAEI